MQDKTLKQEALDYHSLEKPGKIEVRYTKPFNSQKDLSLAYTPGVAEVCMQIKENPQDAYKYTTKSNLVAVVTNGTAVLGLGDIGALAGKPVMEGKGNLFKKFADIDVFDIELNEKDPDKIIEIVAAMEPTFGGINLEDIKAPECFYIEDELKKKMNIPVFHDDQHGTAVVSGAALLNALEISQKEIQNIRVVISGAGAAGIACAKFYVSLGVKRENIIMIDSKGVIYKGRTEGMNPYKEMFATTLPVRTLKEALEGADVFFGLSQPNILTKEMVKSMNDHPIIFAMANPTPEITYEEAKEANPNAIVGTGRSDYPNQINNVLVFPFIFRGALDTMATAINEEMKIAAAKALANLAKMDVPEGVLKAYGLSNLKFGPDYIIPKPFDPRALIYVSSAVAQAAIDSKVARIEHFDMQEYKKTLELKLDKTRSITRYIYEKAKENPKRVVFTETTNPNILRAVQNALEEGIFKPVFVGSRGRTKEFVVDKVKELGLNPKIIDKIEFIDPMQSPKRQHYIERLLEIRQRKGITKEEAGYIINHRPNVFATMMVREGDADALLIGETYNYPTVIRPILQVTEKSPNVPVAGVYVMVIKNRIYLFADTTININPNSQTLAYIAIETAKFYTDLTNAQAVVAMLSFSNFGSNDQEEAIKVKKAVEIAKSINPDLLIEGEMQATIASDVTLRDEFYPFNTIKGKEANVFIFPNLDAGNISYKLMYKLGGAYPIGPILLGLKKSIHVLEMGSPVRTIEDMIALAVFDAQRKERQNGNSNS
ncbi:MAG: NADP-dependent malic enzyme [Desulfurella sp.]|uniref:NADP-dependent malic enzyme n=1 Tax=Desulfurella sp. TaxID=1962857 RepID=UPI003D1371D9